MWRYNYFPFWKHTSERRGSQPSVYIILFSPFILTKFKSRNKVSLFAQMKQIWGKESTCTFVLWNFRLSCAIVFAHSPSIFTLQFESAKKKYYCHFVFWYFRISYAKLPTYPSPKPTLILTSHLRQNVGLGEG